MISAPDATKRAQPTKEKNISIRRLIGVCKMYPVTKKKINHTYKVYELIEYLCKINTSSTSDNDDYETEVCSRCQHRPVNITAVKAFIMNAGADAC